jgi:hypothetical protein
MVGLTYSSVSRYILNSYRLTNIMIRAGYRFDFTPVGGPQEKCRAVCEWEEPATNSYILWIEDPHFFWAEVSMDAMSDIRNVERLSGRNSVYTWMEVYLEALIISTSRIREKVETKLRQRARATLDTNTGDIVYKRETLLMVAAGGDHYGKAIPELVRLGADVNGYTYNAGNTALNAAIDANQFQNCKLLLECGADANPTPDEGDEYAWKEEFNPLERSSNPWNWKQEITKLVRLHGATDPDEYESWPEQMSHTFKAQDVMVRIIHRQDAPISRLPEDVLRDHLFTLLV